MSDLVEKLKIGFQDSDYRHAYCDEFLNSFIATQIKILREQRGWTQEKLATFASLHQSQISEMEDVSYSSWTLNTLRKLAEAFDLTLSFSFEEFGKRIKDIAFMERERLERSSFKDDDFFKQPIPPPSGYQTGNVVGIHYQPGTVSPSPPISDGYKQDLVRG